MTGGNVPGVSVIIPCFNMGRFIAEALESVLSQGHDNLDILLIDDGSTDDTPQRVKRWGDTVRYLWQENAGPAVARNRGLAAARHELVTFLDADDFWPKDKLRTQMAELMDDSELDFVLGNQQGFSLKPGASEDSRDYAFAQPHFIFLVGCGLYRRRVFERVGIFDESMRYSEDTDWFFRCREAHARYKLLASVGVYYRHHDGGMTHGRGAIDKGFLEAIKKSIDRRRVSGVRELEWIYGDQFSPKSGHSIDHSPDPLDDAHGERVPGVPGAAKDELGSTP